MQKKFLALLAVLSLVGCTEYNYPNHHAYVVNTGRPANTVVVKQPVVVRSSTPVVVHSSGPVIVR